jgi:hypothetical protein
MANMAPRHLTHFPHHGKHKPPFKAGTPEYARWIGRLRTQYNKLRPDVSWPEYYAQAKADAVKAPPVDITTRPKKPKLFGGALTREYRAWYYRVQCAARAANTQDRFAFFKAAREAEERRQGLIPNNVVRLNPHSCIPRDGRLMFDFKLPEDRDEGWR